MKRFTAIMMALLMCFALVACGEPAESGDTTDPGESGTRAPEDSGKVDVTVERQVTEEQWNAALDTQKFYNVTVEYGEVYVEDNFSVTIAYDGDWNKEFATVEGILYEDVSRNDGDMDSDEIGFMVGFGKDHFDSFEYDEETKTYRGKVFYEYDEEYLFLVYGFENGNLTEFRLYEEVGEDGLPANADEYLFLNFSDYGTTEVEDPADAVKAALESALSESTLTGATFYSVKDGCDCDDDLTDCECYAMHPACVCRVAVDSAKATEVIRDVDWTKLDTVTFEDGRVVFAVFDHSYEKDGTYYGGLRVKMYFDGGRLVRYENSVVENDVMYVVQYAS
ncbi:MAG: hypothetical protein IJX46_06530 [Clostridia bacterium]|nr:hypothetical protein [Clostridia bacterium]